MLDRTMSIVRPSVTALSGRKRPFSSVRRENESAESRRHGRACTHLRDAYKQRAPGRLLDPAREPVSWPVYAAARKLASDDSSPRLRIAVSSS